MVLLQQVGQSGEVLPGQHVHHHHIPHGVARQEAVTIQTEHPAPDSEEKRQLGRGGAMRSYVFHFVRDTFPAPEAFVHSDRNVSGGPERLNVLEVRHFCHLVAGLPPV